MEEMIVMDIDQAEQMAPPQPTPSEAILQRLAKLGIPMDYIEKREEGLAKYFGENRWRVNELVHALLPSSTDVQAHHFSSSEVSEECREGVRWVQWLMFEGNPSITLDSIKGAMGSGERGICGAIWGSNDLICHCRTCQNDPTCAICLPCFRAGDHTNHDFSLIYASGGGCCDCGDITAWKPSGFCSRHRGPIQAPPLPESVITSATPTLEALLLVWSESLQEAGKASTQGRLAEWEARTSQEMLASDISWSLSEMLLTFCNLSESMLVFIAGVIRSNNIDLFHTLLHTEYILPKAVVTSLYELLFKLLGDASFKYQFAIAFIKCYPWLIRQAMHEEFEPVEGHSSLSSFSAQIFTVPVLTLRLVYELKLLDMLLESLKEVLLHCTGDDGQLMVSQSPIGGLLELIKDIYFVMGHSEVSLYVARERADLTRAWLHLLAYIQGMNPQKRATDMHVEEENSSWGSAAILELSMARIHCFFVEGASIAEEHNVDAKMSHQKDACLDLEHVKNPSLISVVPLSFLWLISECTKVLDVWLALDAAISKWESGDGATNEIDLFSRGRSDSMARVFLETVINDTSNAERNPEQVGMFREWACRGRQNIWSSEYTTNEQLRRVALQTIQESSEPDLMGLNVRYLGEASNYYRGEKEWPTVDFDGSQQEISLHIPLHRFLARVLRKSIEYYTMDQVENFKSTLHVDGSLLESPYILLQMFPTNYQVPSFAAFLLEHPLRIQVLWAQVQAGMMRRNGQSLSNLCDLYRSSQWCEDGYYLDLFLLQCCGVMAPSEEFVDRIVARFGLTNYFSLILLRPNEYEPVLAHEMLMLVIRIVSERGFCGLSVDGVLRRELIRGLAIHDLTRSELMQYIPCRLSDDKHLQETLDAVASYCHPSGMQQGKYSLRKHCWEELDLYHPMWTPRELQCAEDRYLQNCKMSPVVHHLPCWREPLSPLHCLYKIAISRKVNIILRSIFFHAAFSEKVSESRAPEAVLITALHLFALGLDICSKLQSKQNDSLDNKSHDLFSAPFSPNTAQDPILFLTQVTEKVYVYGEGTSERHSTLSLMVLLMRRYSSADSQSTTPETSHCNVADLIKLLLRKFANLDRGCMHEIELLAPEIRDTVTTHLSNTQSELRTDNQKLAEAEKRRAAARARQSAIMAKMKADQERFAASLQQSDENIQSDKGQPQDNGKKVREMEAEINSTEVDMSTKECALCRDTGSKSPLSFLTLVQRSRLVEIYEKGIPSWEGAMESTGKEVASSDVEMSSIEALNPEHPNPIGLLSLIQMELDGNMNGNMDAEGFEVDARLDIFQAGVSESLVSTERLSNDSTDARMSDSGNGSSDFRSDETTNENIEGNGDSTTSMTDGGLTVCEGNVTDSRSGDEINRTREKAMATILVEYVSALSRNLKEQQNANDGDLHTATSEPQCRRTSSLLDHQSFGVHMLSCGHTVHQECLNLYLSSLRQRYHDRLMVEGRQIVDPEQGEFLCPVCRRMANSVLPVLPITHSFTLSASQLIRKSTKTLLVNEAINILQDAEDLVSKLSFQKVVSKFLPISTDNSFDLLFSRLYEMHYQGRDLSIKSHIRASQSLLLWDMFRYTMMSEELAARTRTIPPSSHSETGIQKLWRVADSSKGSILPMLFNAAKATQSQNRQSMLVRARGLQLLEASICHGVSKDSISHLSIPGNISHFLVLIDKGQEGVDTQFWHCSADPVLAHDPFSTLTWLIFCLPASFPYSTQAFIALVHLLYLVCISQAIGFSSAEDPKMSLVDQSFVQPVYMALSNPCFTSVACESTTNLSELPLIVRRLTLPYLRRCALLQRLLFNTSDPSFLEQIDIPKTFSFALDDECHDNQSRKTVEAVQEELMELDELEYRFSIPPLQEILRDVCSKDLILKWCNHLLKEKGRRQFRPVTHPCIPTTPLQLFCRPFQLMKLPALYQDLIQRYMKEQCPTCRTVPEQPALCLVCGRLCCAVTQKWCCSVNGQSECFRHAMSCGAGISVYLMIRRTIIILQRCARQAYWPSPYLDAYGEEDIDMARGNLLYLNEERYAVLTQMVSSHGIDYSPLVLNRTRREVFRAR